MLVCIKVFLRRTVVNNSNWRFNNLTEVTYQRKWLWWKLRLTLVMTSAHVVQASLEFYRQQYFSGPLWELGFTFLFIVKQLRNYFILFSFNCTTILKFCFYSMKFAFSREVMYEQLSPPYLKYKWTSRLWLNEIFKQKMVYTIQKLCCHPCWTDSIKTWLAKC